MAARASNTPPLLGPARGGGVARNCRVAVRSRPLDPSKGVARAGTYCLRVVTHFGGTAASETLALGRYMAGGEALRASSRCRALRTGGSQRCDDGFRTRACR